MFKCTEHTGIVVPLNLANIDTDIIIPKQFLKQVNKTGLGKFLFYDWSYINGDQTLKNKKFILNQEMYQDASILLTGENFGCGSSREHAVWALLDWGFKIIIAPSFSDIFYNNSFHNRLFLINLDKTDINCLFDIVKLNPRGYFNINFIDKKITVGKKVFFFNLDDSRLAFFSSNLDSIDMTMKYLDHIQIYENQISDFLINRKDFNPYN